jgi:uncharacterized membrane protein (DUF2068 family)
VRNERKARRSVGLTIIAVGKLLKTVSLIGLGIAALVLADGSPPDRLTHWANLIRVDPSNHYVHHAIAKLAGTSPHKLHEIGVGTFVYAALFGTEGLGLWFQKRWAEYFTIGITTSFIPLEVYELVHHPSVGKAVMLVLNAAAVVYLVVRVRYERRQRVVSAPGARSAPSSLSPARSRA